MKLEEKIALISELVKEPPLNRGYWREGFIVWTKSGIKGPKEWNSLYMPDGAINEIIVECGCRNPGREIKWWWHRGATSNSEKTIEATVKKFFPLLLTAWTPLQVIQARRKALDKREE